METGSETLLVPSFEQAFWRSRMRLRFRELARFEKKKGHFEPEDYNSYANRFAEELTREESGEEIRQIYENAVVILGNRRSTMERSDRSLDCTQFRFILEASQDPEDASQVLSMRSLWVKIPLNQLPPHFDDLFPFPPEELVVPIEGLLDRRAILESLEEWEHALKGRLSENRDQSEYRLRLPSGFTMAVNLDSRETVFGQEGEAGVVRLAVAISSNLASLRINEPLI
jgi:hypothetical protein